jgi:hypothetical protein
VWAKTSFTSFRRTVDVVIEVRKVVSGHLDPLPGGHRFTNRRQFGFQRSSREFRGFAVIRGALGSRDFFGASPVFGRCGHLWFL